MKVGLYDVDSVIPNLALMKLSAWHRSRGDETELFQPLLRESYEKVYASKVFKFSTASYLDDAMETGGTGFSLDAELPPEVEACRPDYSLYGYPHSIGFAMRGCRFRCKFCVVPEKEGRPTSHRTIPEIWTQRTSRFLVLLDNDFFGNPEWEARISEILELDLLVCFSQGLNVRIITDNQAAAIASVKFRNLSGKKKQVHFAWDRIRDEGLVRAGIDRVLAAGLKPHQMAFFVLVGFDTTPEQDIHRVHMLADLGCDPYVMPYKRDDPYQRSFARWVNHKAIFNTVSWADYHGSVKRSAPADKRQMRLPLAPMR